MRQTKGNLENRRTRNKEYVTQLGHNMKNGHDKEVERLCCCPLRHHKVYWMVTAQSTANQEKWMDDEPNQEVFILISETQMKRKAL